MKRMTVYAVTKADILYNVETMINELEADNLLLFPNHEARTEFIEDCVSGIIDKFDLYECDPCGYIPNYEDEVLDLAKIYHYILD